MKKTLALALAVIMICVCALTVSAAETTLPDVDSPAFWGAHSAGIEVTAEGVDITFTSTTYAEATGWFHGPIYILFTDAEAKVNATVDQYKEYWVQRGDNAGWSPLANTWEGMATLNAAGITMVSTCADWDALWATWLDNLKAGCEVKIHAELQESNAVITMELQGLSMVTTVPVDTSKPVYLALSGEMAKLTNIKVVTPEEETPVEPAESKTLTIGDKTFTAEGGKWLYNGEVDASTAANYSMLIFDKNHTGNVAINGYGAALVLNKYGNIVKFYDGANGAFYTEPGVKGAAHFTPAEYATVAFNELAEGEILVIFPNDGAGNEARGWALSLRGLDGKDYFNQVASLEGFTFETAPVEPDPTVPTEPETQPTEPSVPETTQPEATEPTTKPVNPGTGDNSPVMLAAVMMMAAACLIVLVQKKRAF